MCRGDRTKELSLKQYIDKVIPYLSELIEKKTTNQKIQLVVGINFKHTVDREKKYTFHIKSKNMEILPGDKVNDIIKELTASLFENYEEEILILRNGSCYVYDNIEVLGINFHKIEVKRGSSYRESPEWLKNKGATINPQNTKDNRCFLYKITIAINHQNIKHHPQRISKLIPFIPKYNWDGIDFPPGKKEWKIFEKNNEDIALNVLSVPYNKEKIEIQYRSKYNRKRKNQVAILMITDNKNTYHYLALKSISTDNDYMKPTKSI